MRQQEADDMARATQAGDDYWAAIDQRIEQAVARAVEAALKIERKNNRAVMAEVLAQLQHALDQRLDKAIRVTDDLVTRVTALADGGPDGNGIVRKQVITPH
jgi:hypothetical protein